MTRFATVPAALTPGHPLSVHIDPMAVKADFDRNAKAMELNVDQLGLIEFNSQVAQSIDRSLILAGVTKERHAKVSFASQPNMQTWAIAKTLGVRAGLRKACQIGRASCRERVCQMCKYRWSYDTLHKNKKK